MRTFLSYSILVFFTTNISSDLPPPEKPFQFPKNLGGENIKNNAKGFSGGTSVGLPAQAAGLGSRILLEIGSNFGVQWSQT